MKKPADKRLALRDANLRDERGLTKWQRGFLRVLRKTPNVKAACAVARISRQTAYLHRQNNATFARLWEDAIEASVDELEATAFKLAGAGDSNLITFLLRCHRPEKYRETSRHEIDARLCGIVIVPPKEDKAP